MAGTYEATAGKRLVSSFLGVLARLGVGNFALLTTTGRRSGRSRTVTIAPISEVRFAGLPLSTRCTAVGNPDQSSLVGASGGM